MVNVGKYTIHGFFGYWWSTIPVFNAPGCESCFQTKNMKDRPLTKKIPSDDDQTIFLLSHLKKTPWIFQALRILTFQNWLFWGPKHPCYPNSNPSIGGPQLILWGGATPGQLPNFLRRVPFYTQINWFHLEWIVGDPQMTKNEEIVSFLTEICSGIDGMG